MPRNVPSPPDSIGFRAVCVRATLYVLLVACLAQGAYLEALYLPDNRFSERGFTEFAQAACLALTALVLLYSRLAYRQLPYITLLLLAFVVASLIREQDYWLDNLIARNTWKVLVALVVIPSLYRVIHQRRQFIDEFAHYSNTFSFGLFAAGFLTTYVFSRLYGRADFWMAVLEEAYVRDFKSAAEELVELLGYAFLLIAAIELLLLARRWAVARQRSA
ncbi:hypothetical protein [Halomonas faecis]|uniref:hypothetical protein n=1 Tax=Halomonas faecis TaxID=1562110 RepID=UPI0013D01703|nr:hypothetical protein [Halomonas faecis]